VAAAGGRRPPPQRTARKNAPTYDGWDEYLHGIARNGVTTVYPQAIGLAAAWGPALLRTVADAISTETRATATFA